jgi:hypothetical protein
VEDREAIKDLAAGEERPFCIQAMPQPNDHTHPERPLECRAFLDPSTSIADPFTSFGLGRRVNWRMMRQVIIIPGMNTGCYGLFR